MSLQLVKFGADWCQPCQKMKPVVEKIVNDFNVDFVDINIDNDCDSTTEHNVRSIPTLLLLKDGKEVVRIIGSKTMEQLKVLISTHM